MEWVAGGVPHLPPPLRGFRRWRYDSNLRCGARPTTYHRLGGFRCCRHDGHRLACKTGFRRWRYFSRRGCDATPPRLGVLPGTSLAVPCVNASTVSVCACAYGVGCNACVGACMRVFVLVQFSLPPPPHFRGHGQS